MKPQVAPPRLIEGEGSISLLLREAAHEYHQNLDAHGALQRQQASAVRPRMQRSLLVLALAGGLALAVGVLFVHFHTPSPDLLAQPEPELGPARPQSAPSTIGQTSPPPTRAQPGNQVRAQSSQGSPARSSLPSHPAADAPPSVSATALSAQPSTAPSPSAAEAVAPSAPAADCLGFARAGDAPKAEHCFEEQAAGQNLSAEVALYELARLRRDMLGKPEAALSALDDYARRFPRGYLSGEVLFSRLELLVKLGRSADVLHASDELLASASGKERALEIHFLRGNVYAHALKDPASAAREYAQAASAPGRVGDDAAFLSAVSLESAGDVARAVTGYEHYLARSSARHHAEAQTRLDALRVGATSEPP